MKALSIDIRSRLISAKNAGEGSVRKLAERFKVGESTVQRLYKIFKKTGSLDPLPHGGGVSPKIPDSDLDKFIELVKEKPDISIKELSVEWEKRYGVKVSPSSISRALKRCKLTVKKRLIPQLSVIQKLIKKSGKLSKLS
jgi:transposase